MSTHLFTAQDASGHRCRIQLIRNEDASQASHAATDVRPFYMLEDGSHVRRVDNDTFQVISTGAYVTRVSD